MPSGSGPGTARRGDAPIERAGAASGASVDGNYREVFDATSDALFIHDETGRILDVNERTCTLFGCDRETILGATADRMSLGESPYSAREANDWVRRAITVGPQVFEWQCRRLNGELFWAEVALRACQIGGQTRVIASVRDIAERRQAAEALRLHNDRLRLIAAASRSVLTGVSLAELATAEARRIRAAFDVDLCVIRTLDGDGLVLLARDGEANQPLAERFPAHEGLAAEILQTRRALTVPDVFVDPRTGALAQPAPGRYLFISYAGAPLLYEDAAIGVIGIYTSRHRRDFTPTDLEHLQIVANNIAAAIRNHRLFEQVTRQKEQLELDIAERERVDAELRHREAETRRQSEVLLRLMMGGTLFGGDLDGALAEITAAGAELVQTERVSVWWYEDEDRLLRCRDAYQRSTGAHTHGETLCSADFPTYTASHRQGQPVAASDVYGDPRTCEIPASYWQAHNVRALVDAPIWLHGQLGGVLSFEHVGGPRSWTSGDERLATTLGTLVSLCVESAARRRGETALTESEGRYRMLFELSNDGTGLLHEGRFVECNARLAELFGCPREQIVGAALPDFAPPQQPDGGESREQARMYVAAALDHQPQLFEWRCRRADGQTRDAEISLARVDLGDRPHVLILARDITERKGLEEQLRQSQKMEAVGQLAGGVAHDFNNILTAILGNVELVRGDIENHYPLAIHLIDGLRQIQRSAERAAALTRQLLAFSRRQVVHPEVINLNATLRELEKMLSRLLTENIALEQVLAPNLHNVRADAGQLTQVIINLVVNARDAMPNGGTLTIRTGNVTLDEAYVDTQTEAHVGEHVVLTVSDTGCGMDAATLSRIFEPFFTTKPVGQGTGLGLSTVYGIIKQAGGHVTVYSEPGHGATFRVYLPSVPEVAPVHAAPPDVAAPAGHETILVCEDDATVRDLTARVLTDQGYEVLVAHSAGHALRLVEQREGPLDLVITDVIMPDMNGRQLVQALGAARPGLRSLYVSGYTFDVIAHHGVLDADVEFLEKPYSRRQLLQKVRGVLDRRESAETT